MKNNKVKSVKKMIMICGLVLALTATMALSAGATMITGDISFSGSTSFDNVNLNYATRITSFSNSVVSAAGGTGDYASVTGGTNAAFTTFGFRSPNETTGTFQLWTLTDGTYTYSLYATSIVVSFSNSSNIVIEGSGIAYITGYDDTPGTWSISANSAGITASFSSSATAVPEPATILLFGLGIAGLAIFGRRKRGK
jgi:hypothetical protein